MNDKDVALYIAKQITDVITEADAEIRQQGMIPHIVPDFPEDVIAASKVEDAALMKLHVSITGSEKQDGDCLISK